MEFKDFAMILGKSGKYEIHPPKLCASLIKILYIMDIRVSDTPTLSTTRRGVSDTLYSAHKGA